MSSQVAEIRSNLSLASCEPCRKAKVGCNHERPCNRCMKRGLQHLCTYRDEFSKSTGPKHTGDSTRRGLEYRLRQIERSLQHLQRTLHPSAPSIDHTSIQNPAADIVGLAGSQQTSTDVLSRAPSTTSGVAPPSFVEVHAHEMNLGAFEALDLGDHSLVATVSNISVLQEFFTAHEQLKGVLESLPQEHATPRPQQWEPTAEGKKSWQPRLDMGRTVLGNFPPLLLCNDLVRVYFDGFHHIRPVVPRHWVDQVLAEVFQLHGLTEPKTVNGVADAVARIEQSSENNPSGSSSSSLLNWNNVGVLVSMFAIATYTTPQALDPILFGSFDGFLMADEIRAFAFKMHNLAGVCWQLSDPSEHASESLVLLLYYYYILHVVFGEYRPLLDHLYACLITASAAIGLHRESPKEEGVPDDIQRRRCEYAAIYHFDKTRSTFHGRPPLMFRRFGTTPLPVAESEAHSYLIGQFQVAVAREEVLEWILKHPRNPQVGEVVRLQNVIRARYDSIPPEEKYIRETPITANDPCLHIHRILLYLFSLENSFLLQNAVSKRNGVLPESQLLKTSLAMFTTVVRTCEMSAQLSHFSFLLSWLLTTYASASAGIIFATILREQSNHSSSTDILPPPLTSTSHHLRELHIFLEALGSISPADAHFESCKKAFSIFSRVNEAILGMVTTKLPDDGAAVAVPAVDDIAEGLERNMMGSVTLPWLDYAWADSQEEFMFQPTSQIGLDQSY